MKSPSSIDPSENQPTVEGPAPKVVDSRIARNATITAVGTLGSRLLGAVRDMAVASTFSTERTDPFVVAFTIPNALRALLAEGATSAALVPTYSAERQRSDEAAKRFFQGFSSVMMVILIAVTILGILFAPLIVSGYAWGMRVQSPERFENAITLTQWVFPYIFFMGASALQTGLLNAHRVFFWPALVPALLNVAQIIACFAFVPWAVYLGLPPVGALALGALLGGFLQWSALWPVLKRYGLWWRPSLSGFRDPVVRSALRRLAPLTFGLGVYQINVLLSRLFTSYLPAGAQSHFYYAQRLVEIPQGMFAVAISSASLPVLSDLWNAKAHGEFAAVTKRALGGSFFISGLFASVLVGASTPMVRLFFQRGAFDSNDTSATAQTLVALGCGIFSVGACRVLTTARHALGDTRRPVWASTVNLIVFAGCALWLPRYWGIAGIGWSVSVAATAQAAMLSLGLRKQLSDGGYQLSEWWKPLLRHISFVSVAVTSGYALSSVLPGVSLATDLVLIAVTGGTFIMLSVLLKSPELTPILKRVRRR